MNIRLRFSIRTLLILVALAGLYFGCWEVTKRLGFEQSGLDDPPARSGFVGPFDSSPAPFLISRENDILKSRLDREYHLWFLGYTVKLPFQREIELPLISDDDLGPRDGAVAPIYD